jgi:hypothetical protein
MATTTTSGLRYRIADEPLPGALSAWVVNPLWPMLATMLARSWLSAPWFAFNAFALGSASRRREIGWALASVVGAAALTGALLLLDARGLVPRSAARYGVVLVTAWRLFASYCAFSAQAASCELHLHFGGAVKNGAPVALLAMFLPLDRYLGGAAWLFRLVLG